MSTASTSIASVSTPPDCPGTGYVHLGRHEVLAACQVLADAGRCLVRTGRLGEADAVGDLFELLEARLVAGDPGPAGVAGAQSSVGSYSMESEFTQ